MTFYASTNGGGTNLGFPDVCETILPIVGKVPIPYPNTVQGSQAKGSTCSQKVKIDGKKTQTKKTEWSRSSGDEPGIKKGIVSGKHMGKVKRSQAYDKVKVEGASIVTVMKTTGHNGKSANMPAGQQLSPSQTKVTCEG